MKLHPKTLKSETVNLLGAILPEPLWDVVEVTEIVGSSPEIPEPPPVDWEVLVLVDPVLLEVVADVVPVGADWATCGKRS